MITQEVSGSGSWTVLAAVSESLRKTPDSDVNPSPPGNDIAIEAMASPKDDNTGSSASRFGNAKAAMSARRFMAGALR